MKFLHNTGRGRDTAVTKNGQQHGLVSRMLFSELYEIVVNKVTFVGLGWGGDRPLLDSPLLL